MALPDCSVTSRTVAQHIESVTHHSASARTIRRRLQQSGLYTRRLLLCLPLTQNHRRLCHQWSQERRIWALEWNEVVFTDESLICLQHHDGWIKVCRYGEERLLNSCVMHLHTDPTPVIMVWGGIGYHSRTLLVRITGTLNSQHYISEVLEPVVLTYHQGHLRVSTPNEDRYLAVTAKRKRRNTASDLTRQLSSATGTTVSVTVYRRLGNIGLYASRKVRCVPHTTTDGRLRLTWSREHALWTPQQWSCVMFSDESRFSLQSDSRRTLIWRAPGTRYHQENTIKRHQSSDDRPHLSGCYSGTTCTFLFCGSMGAEFLFMDDNARPQRANIVDERFQSEDITRMDCPAYSPDLNPIQHVWDMLG
ncbi:transposable element Tcb1 transposase [Trichonephila clavipes]|nr:transposable element Tcb1 transposase [Trichonephila clavipes]